jgi:hypothetical protein
MGKEGGEMINHLDLFGEQREKAETEIENKVNEIIDVVNDIDTVQGRVIDVVSEIRAHLKHTHGFNGIKWTKSLEPVQEPKSHIDASCPSCGMRFKVWKGE